MPARIHESHLAAVSAYDWIDKEHALGVQTYPDAAGPRRFDREHGPYRVSIDDLATPATDDGATVYDRGGFPSREAAREHAAAVIATWSRTAD